MPTQRKVKEFIFSSFQDQKVRVLKAAREVEYHFTIAQKNFNYQAFKDVHGSEHAEDISDFYFKVETALFEIRKDRLFKEPGKTFASQTYECISRKNFGVVDAVALLKASVSDLIDLFVAELGKSIFMVSHHTQNGRSHSIYAANLKELKILEDVMNLYVNDIVNRMSEYR